MRKLAIVSSYQEECGAAFYSSRLRVHLERAGFVVDVKRLPVALLRVTWPASIRRKAEGEIDRIAKEIKEYDAVLLQFEPGLYGTLPRISYPRVRRLLSAAKRAVVTVHGFHRGVGGASVLGAVSSVLSGRLIDAREELEMRSRNLVRYASRFWSYVRRSPHIHVLTFCRADEILLRRFFDLQRITNYPITYFDQSEVAEIRHDTDREALLAQFGLDSKKRYFGVFGFLSAYKGHLTAIKALEYLPEEWHLAIIGGEHPHGLEADRDIGAYLRQLLAFPLEAERKNGHGSTLTNLETELGGLFAGTDVDRMELKGDILAKTEFRHFLPNREILSRIHFLGQVADEEMARLYTTIDFAVHPYIKTKSGQSGSGPGTMAIEFGARSLFTNVPVFREMNLYFPGAMTFFNVGNFLELAESLQRYGNFEQDLASAREEALIKYNPSGMVETYLQLLQG